MPEATPIDTVESWYVYIVRCADASLYTGITNRIDERLAMHNAGRGARYTRGRRPVELVYLESADDRGAALRREVQIKRLKAERKRELASLDAVDVSVVRRRRRDRRI